MKKCIKMYENISARLIKDLELRGFSLDFPSYEDIEEEIIEILKSKNKRLYLSLPLLFLEEFDYDKIRKAISRDIDLELDKIISISAEIFKREKIQKKLDKKGKYSLDEFRYYYGSFKESITRKESIDEKELSESIKIRSKLNTNESLSKIFSPGKIKIMEKIFNHEKLSNTELKYYYRAIRPLIHAILNKNMQDYSRLVDSLKKYHD